MWNSSKSVSRVMEQYLVPVTPLANVRATQGQKFNVTGIPTLESKSKLITYRQKTTQEFPLADV